MEDIIIGMLLLTSIVGLSIIVERGWALRAANIIPPVVESALESCRTDADLPMLRGICEQHPSPLSRLLLQAGERRGWSKAENASALETSARHEIARMERRLVILEIVVGVAPLLGLVGTIYGLIELFSGLSQTGMGDNNALAHGIALALNSTLLGLLTAIPALIFWSYYNKKVENYSVEMAALCERFLMRAYHPDAAAETQDARVRRGPS
jgi:biopolymer transport protein ExbB